MKSIASFFTSTADVKPKQRKVAISNGDVSSKVSKTNCQDHASTTRVKNTLTTLDDSINDFEESSTKSNKKTNHITDKTNSEYISYEEFLNTSMDNDDELDREKTKSEEDNMSCKDFLKSQKADENILPEIEDVNEQSCNLIGEQDVKVSSDIDGETVPSAKVKGCVSITSFFNKVGEPSCKSKDKKKKKLDSLTVKAEIHSIPTQPMKKSFDIFCKGEQSSRHKWKKSETKDCGVKASSNVVAHKADMTIVLLDTIIINDDTNDGEATKSTEQAGMDTTVNENSGDIEKNNAVVNNIDAKSETVTKKRKKTDSENDNNTVVNENMSKQIIDKTSEQNVLGTDSEKKSDDTDLSNNVLCETVSKNTVNKTNEKDMDCNSKKKKQSTLSFLTNMDVKSCLAKSRRSVKVDKNKKTKRGLKGDIKLKEKELLKDTSL